MRNCFLLVSATALVLIAASCRHVDRDDACGLLSKADVDQVVGARVTGTVVEPAHAMSMSEGRVMETTASCTYSLEAAPGKPARVKLSVDVFKVPQVAGFKYYAWKGAQPVRGIGEQAMQDFTALEILYKGVVLVIETNETADPPQEPVPPDEQNEGFPRIQLELARIALGRL